MRTLAKISKRRKDFISTLTTGAIVSMRKMYGENFTDEMWTNFYRNLYSIAAKSNKKDWKYNIEEAIINLSK
jgi:hypothetical protein